MPRDGSATRERILTTAERLVIDNGYAATSVDQVIAGSGTSKGAFFHHFDSKRALADALIERYVAGDLAQLEAALEHARSTDGDAVARALAFVQYFEDAGDELMQEQSGCLYTSILTERQLAAAGASDPIAKAVVAWREGYAELLRDAMEGAAHEVDVDAVSDHLFVTFEGAFLLARTTGDPSHMRTQLKTLRVLLEGLLRAQTRR